MNLFSVLHPLDWLILLVYFGLLVLLTLRRYSPDPSETDFLLSGRRMTLPAFVATLVSTWYGGILGIGEYSFQFGISQLLLFGIPFYVFSAVFAVFLAGRIRENDALTLPEAVSNRYGRRTGFLSAFPIFILVSPAPYILMIGLLFQFLMGGQGPFLAYAVAVALFSVAYVSIGGFSAVVRTDMLQVALMFTGFVVLLAFAFGELGGVGAVWNGVPPLYRDLSGGHSVQYLLVWFFIALWTFVDPSFHQRAAAAQSPAVARRGIFISIAAWSAFDLLTVFSGMSAFLLLGNGLENPVLAYPAAADLLLPIGWKGVFFVSLFATIMSTMDSYLFISGQTLGRDVLKGFYPGVSATRLTRIGVSVSALLGIVLILLFPSVVNLWYVIGSVFIPGLLIPILGIYVEPLRLRSGWADAILIGATSTSAIWLALGVFTSTDLYSYAYLGIEPFYPGLGVSLVLWAFGRLRATSVKPT